VPRAHGPSGAKSQSLSAPSSWLWIEKSDVTAVVVAVLVVMAAALAVALAEVGRAVMMVIVNWYWLQPHAAFRYPASLMK
jgi:hypothetical protein